MTIGAKISSLVAVAAASAQLATAQESNPANETAGPLREMKAPGTLSVTERNAMAPASSFTFYGTTKESVTVNGKKHTFCQSAWSLDTQPNSKFTIELAAPPTKTDRDFTVSFSDEPAQKEIFYSKHQVSVLSGINGSNLIRIEGISSPSGYLGVHVRQLQPASGDKDYNLTFLPDSHGIVREVNASRAPLTNPFPSKTASTSSTYSEFNRNQREKEEMLGLKNRYGRIR